MNVKYYSTKAYENKSNWTLGQNKPNSNPNKPNLRKSKMNVSLTLTKDYRKKDDFLVRINKPNLRNGQNKRNLNYNKGLQNKRLFSSSKNKPNSNPILSAVGGLQKNINTFLQKDYENEPLSGPKKQTQNKACPEHSRTGQSPKGQNRLPENPATPADRQWLQ